MVFRAVDGLYDTPEIATEAYNLVLKSIHHAEQRRPRHRRKSAVDHRERIPKNASLGFPNALIGLDQHAPTSHMQQRNAGIQQEMGGGILL